MIFFSRKPKPMTLPPGWPSPYYNKCSQRDCTFPNSPQTVKGAYPCRGVPGGFYCEGTYKISSSRAQETERYFKEAMARRAAAAAVAEEQQHRRTRTTSEMPRPDLIQNAARHVQARRGRDVPHVNVNPYATADDRRHPAGYHSNSPLSPTRARHPSRSTDVGARPPQLPPRTPSYGGHRPPSQVEAEYITDQIMMRLYPERKIQPRWL